MIRLLKPRAFLFAVAQASLSNHCLLCGPAAGVLLQEGDGANLAWLATVSVSPLTSASRQHMPSSHPRVCWEALSAQLPHCALSSLSP